MRYHKFVNAVIVTIIFAKSRFVLLCVDHNGCYFVPFELAQNQAGQENSLKSGNL